MKTLRLTLAIAHGTGNYIRNADMICVYIYTHAYGVYEIERTSFKLQTTSHSYPLQDMPNQTRRFLFALAWPQTSPSAHIAHIQLHQLEAVLICLRSGFLLQVFTDSP